MFLHEPSREHADNAPPGPLRLPRVRARVLVVEDNDVNRKVAVGLLRKFGCEVEIAENGQNAVERMGREQFDVIFMDCAMPIMDGYEAAETIRERETRASAPSSDAARSDAPSARIPIVAVTARVMPEEQKRCFECGMDDYIAKPIDLKSLARILKKFCADRINEPSIDLAPEIAADLAPRPSSRSRFPAGVLNADQLRVLGTDDLQLVRTSFPRSRKKCPS